MANKRQINRRRFWVRVLAVVLAVLLVGWTVGAAILSAFSEAAPPVRDRYQMSILLDPDAAVAAVTERVTYTNRTGGRLSDVLFQVYANSFRRESTLPYAGDDLEDAFPAGFAPGGVVFSSIQVNGAAADWGVQGDAELFLRVACALDAGETCEITLTYHLLLTENRAFLGMGDQDIRLVMAYPALCVWEAGEYILNNSNSVGRYFFAECADYEVQLTLPETYEIAASCTQTRAQAADGYAAYRITGENVREFALVASRKFHTQTGTSALGTAVYACGSDRAAVGRMLQSALDALNVLETWLGKFPYDAYRVVQSEYALDGLSASGLSIVGQAANVSREETERTMFFLTARQYFGLLSQANPVREPWLSDAVSTYLSLLIEEEIYGETRFSALLNEKILPALTVTIPGGVNPDSAATVFRTRSEYRIIICWRGAAAMHELRNAMGREEFLRGLARYLQDSEFSTTSIADFAAALNAATDGAWDQTLLDWLYNIGDYADGYLEEYS